MAATLYAIEKRVVGTSWANAYQQVGGPVQNLDILQIVGEGGKILLNVDFNGVVHNPAVNPTTSAGGVGNARIGQFYSRLTSSATTAQLFADAFSQNVSQQDIIQIISPAGGAIVNYIDYLGVSH